MCDADTDTFASPNGCYGELYKRGGHILLIGVGNDKNTFIHCAEEMLDVPNRNASKKIKTTVRHRDGSIDERMLYPMYTEGTDDISEYFPKFDAAFSHLGVERRAKLGNAEIRLLSAVGIKLAVERIFIASGGKEVLLCDGEIPKEYYI
jgi:aminoglycoside 3-N-acetyltransferase